MKSEKILIILFTIILIILLINLSIIFMKISEFKKEVVGFATGYVNLTISTTLSINMTRDTINWSEGTIDSGELNATIYTSGENNGIVERGNWTGENAKGFIIENIGTINSSLKIQTNKNAHDFFNSSASLNEQYQWNVTNKEANSCSGDLSLGVWEDVNKTTGGTKYCNQFDFKEASNEIYIDLLLTVPADSLNLGLLSDTITVTADTAG